MPARVAKNARSHRVPLTGSSAHRGKKAASILCRALSFEFRAHDLRRTAARRLAEPGVPRDHIAKVLNHIEGGPAATRVYDRYVYDAEKRDVLERWARRLLAIIEGKTRKIVAIGR
jgi:integrase